MSAPTIRAATAHDTEIIKRLQRQVLPWDKVTDPTVGWWWLAIDGGVPVGFAGMVQSSRWMDAIYLCRAGVVAKARGQGLQGRLINVRQRLAKRMGKRWLITDTNGNPASANTLINCGFKMYEPADPWAYKGACYWRKRIAP